MCCASCYEWEAKKGGGQGELVSENALIPSGMPEAHHGKGAAFSAGHNVTLFMTMPLIDYSQ